MAEKGCMVCGEELIWHQRYYCSRKCSNTARSRRRYPDAIHVGSIVKCPICGNEFTKTTQTQKYCSRKCKSRSVYLRKKQQRPVETKNCLVCGKPFVPGSAAAKYCSDECRAFAAKKRRMGLM